MATCFVLTLVALSSGCNAALELDDFYRASETPDDVGAGGANGVGVGTASGGDPATGGNAPGGGAPGGEGGALSCEETCVAACMECSEDDTCEPTAYGTDDTQCGSGELCNGAGQCGWDRLLNNPAGNYTVDAVGVSNGNVAIAGTFMGTLDLGEGTVQPLTTPDDDDPDFFIAVIRSDGVLQSLAALPAREADATMIRGVVLLPSGDAVALAKVPDNTTVGPLGAEVTSDGFDLLMFRLAGAGPIDFNLMGGTSDQEVAGLSNVGNSLVVAGHFGGQATFDGCATEFAPGGSALFVSLFDASTLTCFRMTAYGSAATGVAKVHAVAAHATGKIAITGTFTGDLDIHNASLSSVQPASFLAMVDAGLMEETWGHALYGSPPPEPHDLAMTDTGDVLITGVYESTLTHSGTCAGSTQLPSALGPSNAFVARLSATDGCMTEAHAFALNGSANARSLRIATSANNIALGGYVYGNLTSTQSAHVIGTPGEDTLVDVSLNPDLSIAGTPLAFTAQSVLSADVAVDATHTMLVGGFAGDITWANGQVHTYSQPQGFLIRHASE